MNDNQHYDDKDDARWVTVEDFSSPYQIEIHIDGRRRWRRRSGERTLATPKWQPGHPPEE